MLRPTESPKRLVAMVPLAVLTFLMCIQTGQANAEGQVLDLAVRSAFLEFQIQTAANDSWAMLTGGVCSELTYQGLIDSGALPIIVSNPCTGEDVISTRDYSPGDIFLSFPTQDDPVFRFWRHLGEDDFLYDADLAAEHEIVPLEDLGESYSTDGRTIYWEEEVPEDFTPYLDVSVDPSAARSANNFPPDDRARVMVFVVSSAFSELVRAVRGSGIDVPQTLDGYISLVGRKNPVSWTNPYTGEPMRQVPWVILPFYSQSDQVTGRIPDSPPDPQEGIDGAVLAGNYSFVIGSCPYYDGDYTASVQFYFYLPDGGVAAYFTAVPR